MGDSRQQIEQLLYRYAQLHDSGDFDGVAALFGEDGVYQRGDGTAFRGREIAEHRKRTTILYDGSPRCMSVTTNVVIEVDEDAGTATAQSYYLFVQQPPGEPLRVLIGGRYHDQLRREDGEWRFVYRRGFTDLMESMESYRKE